MQRFILPFLSGFLAVLFFQQSAIGLLHAAGLTAQTPFSLERVAPFGLPGFIVAGVVSGVYAIVMAWLLRVDSRRAAPWLAAFVYGGIVPTAVTIFVIGPLQGMWPTGNILPEVAFGFASNGLWGWGALVFIRAMSPQTGNEAFDED